MPRVKSYWRPLSSLPWQADTDFGLQIYPTCLYYLLQRETPEGGMGKLERGSWRKHSKSLQCLPGEFSWWSTDLSRSVSFLPQRRH